MKRSGAGTSSEITRCPICDSTNIEPFYERRGVPVHQNIVCDTRLAAKVVIRGNLSFVLCECGFAFNREFDEALLSYDGKYNNAQAASPRFSAYLDSIVGHLALDGQRVIEIGCGQGDFLLRLADKNECTGYDPTYAGTDKRFVRGYYDNPVPCDIIICRHVIEHVADPLALIRACNAPRVFFETPDFNWIIHRSAWRDFFYEHCNYFTAATLERAFEVVGFTGTASPAFGGQYLWYTGCRVGSGS